MAAEIVASLFCLGKYVGIRGVFRQLVLVEEKSAAAWKFTGLDGTDQPRSVKLQLSGNDNAYVKESTNNMDFLCAVASQDHASVFKVEASEGIREGSVIRLFMGEDPIRCTKGKFFRGTPGVDFVVHIRNSAEFMPSESNGSAHPIQETEDDLSDEDLGDDIGSMEEEAEPAEDQGSIPVSERAEGNNETESENDSQQFSAAKQEINDETVQSPADSAEVQAGSSPDSSQTGVILNEEADTLGAAQKEVLRTQSYLEERLSFLQSSVREHLLQCAECRSLAEKCEQLEKELPRLASLDGDLTDYRECLSELMSSLPDDAAALFTQENDLKEKFAEELKKGKNYRDFLHSGCDRMGIEFQALQEEIQKQHEEYQKKLDDNLAMLQKLKDDKLDSLHKLEESSERLKAWDEEENSIQGKLPQTTARQLLTEVEEKLRECDRILAQEIDRLNAKEPAARGF